jgi:predicted RNA-binding Zn ribbon-like protein
VARSDTANQFDFSGGELCLDFANTLGDRPRGHDEHLSGWQDLLAWAQQAGLVSAREAGALRSAGSAGAARDAERAFQGALVLRECLYRLFAGVAAGTSPPRDDVARFNEFLAETMPHARVRPEGRGLVWTWEPGPASFDRLLWPVVRSAADLLVSAERVNVRECGSEVCSWLFVDRSRTKVRRWCSMKTCGNRAKARRFYTRHREAATRQ